MTTIILFDIDGTLLRAGGAGRRSVERALDRLTGRAHGTTNLESVEFAGRTDRWIMGAALAHCGAPTHDAMIDEVIDHYLELLPTELQASTGFEVMPGARGLLEKLCQASGIALGLGTGNVERAAYAKLRRAALDPFFAFGGFGCDHVDRAALLRAGLARGLAHARVDEARVVVIGDTPHDVDAAHAIGAECIAVCTGWFDEAPLHASGAELVVPSLQDPRVLGALATPSLA
ncbi:MAG: HAD family hydrolase [Polyangiales bacterium]